MGTYATTTSFPSIIVGYTFDSITTNVVAKAITQAETEVNKFLSKRYDVGDWSVVGDVPPLVTTLTEWFAAGLSIKSLARANKELREIGNDYLKMARDNLTEIAEFKVNLVDSAGNLVPEATSSAKRVLCNTSGYSTTFNEDGDLDQAVDQNKLDDIRNGRT